MQLTAIHQNAIHVPKNNVLTDHTPLDNGGGRD
jgi:hypothetical protein